MLDKSMKDIREWTVSVHTGRPGRRVFAKKCEEGRDACYITISVVWSSDLKKFRCVRIPLKNLHEILLRI
jgi:hypothetical protein